MSKMASLWTVISFAFSLLLTPFLMLLLAIIFLASIGKSLGVRRLYIKLLLALFEVSVAGFVPRFVPSKFNRPGWSFPVDRVPRGFVRSVPRLASPRHAMSRQASPLLTSETTVSRAHRYLFFWGTISCVFASHANTHDFAKC